MNISKIIIFAYKIFKFFKIPKPSETPRKIPDKTTNKKPKKNNKTKNKKPNNKASDKEIILNCLVKKELKYVSEIESDLIKANSSKTEKTLVSKEVSNELINEEIRLNKFMSDAGFCSRREADRLIEKGEVYVDGSRIGEVGSAVIKDRILMSNNGILVIIANIDTENKVLLSTPAVTTRGYILVNENEDLIRDIEQALNEV